MSMTQEQKAKLVRGTGKFVQGLLKGLSSKRPAPSGANSTNNPGSQQKSTPCGACG